MKLDANALRYLNSEDFRILSALEIGSKNHEVVPLSMLASLSRTRPGGVRGRLGELAKLGLVARDHQAGYEGFRLTYGGYDYLALRALSQRGSVTGIGQQIGVGKEADVYLVSGHLPSESTTTTSSDAEPLTESSSSLQEDSLSKLDTFVLKIQRLGRTSFRTVKTNRDYHGKRKHVSWMYLSRLAAEKEWSFLQALYRHNLPTPKPIDWNRHIVVMEWIDGCILDQLRPEAFAPSLVLPVARFLYNQLMDLIVSLSEHGLVHGDFNEFNLLIRNSFICDPQPWLSLVLEEGEEAVSDSRKDLQSAIVIIDFPQMISIRHRNAAEQFNRDVNCLRAFFKRRFGFEAADWPDFDSDINSSHKSVDGRTFLDDELRASGFKRPLNTTDLTKDETTEEDEDGDDNSLKV